MAFAEPMIIVRDWILRASWLCARHHLPLSLLGTLDGERKPRATLRMLELQAEVVQSLRRKLTPTAAMTELNRSVLDHFLGEENAGLRRGTLGYYRRFVANRLHLSFARIALLAAAHSERTRAADRFEDFAGLTTSALFKSGGNVLSPKVRRRAASNPSRVPEGLVTTRVNCWQVDLSGLIEAYVRTIRRGDGQ